MQPTTEILARISRNSLANKDEIFTRLYRYMLRSDLYFLAYKNLYANSGAATKGANDDTADGFSETKIANIIQRLADETYQPTPVRRTYIKKKNNPKKKRPLGIPTFTDKLVQEVLRMVLEAVYEPVFLPVSHGFRPKRSCHTALKSLKMEFNGMRWFVEGDIKGCFDNIDHSVLVGLIHSKIKDARLIKLIYKFLKAGYLEDWKYHKTYSGTPQGGIISPLLANIYLHELDKFVMKLKSEFDTHGQEPVRTEYRLLSNDLQKLSYHIGRRTGAEREQLLSEYNEKYAELSADPRAPLMNRALSGTYPPGSTFKVGIATAALSEHIITPTDTVYCSGTYKYYSDYQPKCWNIWGHGDLDVVHAIGTSCNCFFFEMGRLLTIDNINKYCTLYGFGQPTGIELTDVENTGVLADPDYARDHGLEWTAGRVIATAIGQGYNTFNPLQISCYMSMIVNRGTRYSAHLLGSVREFHTGNIIYKPEPTVAAQFDMDSVTYNAVMEGMGLVVSSPTSMASRYLSDYPVKVGAKTGTAQVGDGSADNCVFAAFAPFDDPQIVFSCVIEHGVNGYYAAKGARDVFDSFFGFNKTADDAAS